MRGIGRLAIAMAAGCGPLVELDDGTSGGVGADERHDGAEIGGDPADESGPASPTCNDGHIDYGELCDDGNDVVGDGCNPDCRISGVKQWEDEIYAEALGEHTEAGAVVIWPEPAAIVVGARALGESTRTAELIAYDFEHARRWQQLDPLQGLDGAVVGLVATPERVAAVIDDSLAPLTSLSLQWSGVDGAVQVITPFGIQGSVAVAASALGDDAIAIAGYDVLGEVPSYWLTAIDAPGTTRWLQIVDRQPAALADVPSGGFVVAYLAEASGNVVERRDAVGGLLWSAQTDCAGPIDVDAGDTVTIVQGTPTGLVVCRIGPDGAGAQDAPVEIGPVSPVALALTSTGDLLVGGSVGDGEVRPWVGRISRAGVLQWNDLPWFGVGTVNAVDIDDELGVAVAVGTTGDDGVYGFISVYSP